MIATEQSKRLVSLDAFRGATQAGAGSEPPLAPARWGAGSSG